MPYRLKKSGSGWKVASPGRTYSKKPMSRAKAKRQLAAIKMHSDEGAVPAMADVFSEAARVGELEWRPDPSNFRNQVATAPGGHYVAYDDEWHFYPDALSDERPAGNRTQDMQDAKRQALQHYRQRVAQRRGLAGVELPRPPEMGFAPRRRGFTEPEAGLELPSDWQKLMPNSFSPPGPRMSEVFVYLDDGIDEGVGQFLRAGALAAGLAFAACVPAGPQGRSVPVIVKPDADVPRDVQDALRKAMDDWTRACHGKSPFREKGAVGVKVVWNDQWSQDPTIGAITRFPSETRDGSFRIELNADSLSHKSPEEMREIIAHEIGHAFGLKHTGDTHDIMSRFSNPDLHPEKCPPGLEDGGPKMEQVFRVREAPIQNRPPPGSKPVQDVEWTKMGQMGRQLKTNLDTMKNLGQQYNAYTTPAGDRLAFPADSAPGRGPMKADTTKGVWAPMTGSQTGGTGTPTTPFSPTTTTTK